MERAPGAVRGRKLWFGGMLGAAAAIWMVAGCFPTGTNTRAFPVSQTLCYPGKLNIGQSLLSNLSFT